MRTSVILASIVLAGLVAGRAGAQCTGTGPVLDVPTELGLGDPVTVNLHADPPASYALFMVSTGDGPTNLGSYGTACLDFPLELSAYFALDANGDASFDEEIPCDPSLIGLTIYLQFISCGGGRKSHLISNMVAVTITDGICDGDLCTFTQGGWGTRCNGGNPGCRRDQWFDTVFPKGVTIGDQGGIDGDGDFALHFTSSAAVEAFLPASKTPGILNADATDPTKSSAGVFAGQLLSARLNIAFDDAGALDDCKVRTDLLVGDLVFVDGVDADLLGWTVRDVIDLADLAISGELGDDGFDLDGDGSDDVTVSDLSSALDVFNNEFDNGTQHLGNLGLS